MMTEAQSSPGGGENGGSGIESDGADVRPAVGGGQDAEGRCSRRARRGEKGSGDGQRPFLNHRGRGAGEGGRWRRCYHGRRGSGGAGAGWGGAVSRQWPDHGRSGRAACAHAAGIEQGRSGGYQVGPGNSAGRRRLNPI
jgi:hypothetical protein